MKKLIAIVLVLTISLSAVACGNTEFPYDTLTAPSTSGSTAPISDNPLIAAEPETGYILNGSKTDVIGLYKYIRIDKTTLKEITMAEYTEFCETVVDSVIYNWVSIICDDGTGIQFTGSQYTIATYGRINYEGVITKDIGYISQTEDGFKYENVE